jgi:large subunit ribosomal protein L19
MNLMERLRSEGLKKLPHFRAGDTVKVYSKIKEGEKERLQAFEGVVLRVKGHGKESSFTVRKISYGVGVERVFPLYSPLIDRIEVVSSGKVRRSRIYYLRDLTGKKARIAEGEAVEKTEEPPAA